MKQTPKMICEINVKGHLSAAWSEWFDGLEMRNTADGNTVLIGTLADQAALIGILTRVQALNLRLLMLSACERDGFTAEVMDSFER